MFLYLIKTPGVPAVLIQEESLDAAIKQYRDSWYGVEHDISVERIYNYALKSSARCNCVVTGVLQK